MTLLKSFALFVVKIFPEFCVWLSKFTVKPQTLMLIIKNHGQIGFEQLATDTVEKCQ